jgi:hypothetical protein
MKHLSGAEIRVAEIQQASKISPFVMPQLKPIFAPWVQCYKKKFGGN